jgi:hypothetical protein
MARDRLTRKSMAMSDLRLALISFMESFWGFAGCGTKCVGLIDSALDCAHALEPIVLVEKAKVELAWDQFF